MEAIKGLLQKIQRNFIERFGDNLRCLMLYGSWAKGTARKDSDIDLLVIFTEIDKEAHRHIDHIVQELDKEKTITTVSTTLEDFLKEKIPLYTAVKKEGKVLHGEVDLSINPEPSEIKYSEFFKKSMEWESRKIRVAEELLEKNLTSGIAEICFVASKHAIQANLAMRGEGYSSKVRVLLPLAERYFGKEIAESFRKLSNLYSRSEYEIDLLTDQEAKLAVEYAKKILGVYLLV